MNILLKNLISPRVFLCESMNVYIDGASYDNTSSDLDTFCNRLIDKFLDPSLKSLPPDQVKYFEKNKSTGYYDTIVPDGSYYGPGGGGGTGIINFYTAGLMTNTIKSVLRSILKEMKKLGMKYGEIKREQSGIYKSQVIRIPVISNRNKYTGAPELNLSNRNAYHIFRNILQYDGENSFSMDPKDLKERIEAAFHDKPWIGQHTIDRKEKALSSPEDIEGDEWKKDDESEETDDEVNPHDKIADKIGSALGGSMISMGLDENQIVERLNKIYEIAMWAIKHGYTKIVVA